VQAVSLLPCRFVMAFVIAFVLAGCGKKGGDSAPAVAGAPSINATPPQVASQACGVDILKEYNLATGLCQLSELTAANRVQKCIDADSSFLRDYPNLKCLGPDGSAITSQNAQQSLNVAKQLLPTNPQPIPGSSPTPPSQQAPCKSDFAADYERASATCDNLTTVTEHKACQASYASLLKKYPQTYCTLSDGRGQQIQITPRALERVVLSMQVSIDSAAQTAPGTSGDPKPLSSCSSKIADDYKKSLAACFRPALAGDLDTPRLKLCESGCETFLEKNSGIDCKILPSTEVSTAQIQYEIVQLKALIATSATAMR